MTAESCRGCQFVFEASVATADIAGSIGVCRRYPPALFVVRGQFVARFPEVTDAAWCGEFQPRGVEKARPDLCSSCEKKRKLWPHPTVERCNSYRRKEQER